MSALPDPHVLDAEATMLRQQAAALHKAGNDALQRDVEKARAWHKQHDPEKAAAAKQAESDRAEAKVWATDAAKYRKMADESDKAARTAADKGLVSDAEEAREAAQRQRALADQEAATATRLEASAAEHEARVRQLDIEADAIWVKESNAIEAVADQIDEKVRFLSEAAQKQREADAMRARGDEPGAAEAERAAEYFVRQADTRKIDISAVSPAILEEAGVREDVLNRVQDEPAADPIDTPQAPPEGPPARPEDVPPAQIADADGLPDHDDLDGATADRVSTLVAQADAETGDADSGAVDPFADSPDPDPGSVEQDPSVADASLPAPDPQLEFDSDAQVAGLEPTASAEFGTESFETESFS